MTDGASTTDGPPVAQGYVQFPSAANWAAGYDPAVVEQYAQAFEQTRQTTTPEALARGVQVATRYAAVDTGALEGLYTTTRGFTRTIAEQSATWEAALGQRDDTVRASITDALNGYELVLDLVTGREQITELWIRELHKVLCASQETYRVFTAVGVQDQQLPKGDYKSLPNNPTNAETGRVFHYAPPQDTPAEMARLVDELTSPAFEGVHPVVQAAYAHYAFVRVHPFADGNGRVARALASVFLYRRPGVPLVVFADQREAYLDALEAADGGRAVTFVEFIGDRTVETIELIQGNLAAAVSPTPEDAAARLRAALDQADSSQAARSLAASSQTLARAEGRILDRVVRQLRATMDATLSSDRLSVLEFEDDEPGDPSPPGGFTTDHPARRFALAVAGPVPFTVTLVVQVWRAAEADHEPALVVQGRPDGVRLELRTADVIPRLTQSAEARLEVWCRQQVTLLAEAATREVTTPSVTGEAPSAP